MLMLQIIGGTEITTWRTAAASAVATKHIFINNNKQGTTLAILGYGVQGKIHAEAFHNFFNFQEVSSMTNVMFIHYLSFAVVHINNGFNSRSNEVDFFFEKFLSVLHKNQ